jgi:signal transduction histidine kinase
MTSRAANGHMNQTGFVDSRMFSRLRRRSSVVFTLLILSLAIQVGLVFYISSEQKKTEQLAGLLDDEKAHTITIGKLIQELVLVWENGQTGSQLHSSIQTALSGKVSDVKNMQGTIDGLLASTDMPFGNLDALKAERASMRVMCSQYLKRASLLAISQNEITGRFLTLTDLIISPNGRLMRGYERIDDQLEQFRTNLRRFGLYSFLALTTVTTLLVAFTIFVVLWRTIIRAENDYGRLMLSMNVRTRYFYQLSHELRTPLNAISGFSEMLQHQSSDPTVKDYGGAISDAGRKLTGHIENIILLSQLQSDSYKISARKFDAATIIREEASALPGESAFRKVELDLPDEILAVHSDSEAFRQIFRQLLRNAHYHARTSATVTARTSGKRVTLLISDDGPGIEPEKLQRLFEPFQTGENSYFTTNSGLGMGLTVANLLAEAAEIDMAVIKNSKNGLTIELQLVRAVD